MVYLKSNFLIVGWLRHLTSTIESGSLGYNQSNMYPLSFFQPTTSHALTGNRDTLGIMTLGQESSQYQVTQTGALAIPKV